MRAILQWIGIDKNNTFQSKGIDENNTFSIGIDENNTLLEWAWQTFFWIKFKWAWQTFF